ncbi:ricin-type beta-trefoil lectin domain protein [Streptomyces sp. NPDC002018]|uniref:ricin-type beta-trefoil lectin domain protein n=1 Tax=Streptomyces sp. NPDC002018 TaxID=3364629 RepID=UPI00368510F2
MWISLSWNGRGTLPGTRAERRGQALFRTGVVAVVFGALMIGALPAAYAVPPDDKRSGVDLIELQKADPVPGEDGGALADLTTAEIEHAEEYEPTRTTAPAGDAATESVSDLSAGDMVPVGDLPIEVGAPDGATAEEAAALEGDWQVLLADQSALAGTNLKGLVFTVRPPADASGDAVVALDYTEFTELYGADWADRLQFTQYPECFLDAPGSEECSEPTEVHSENVVERQPGDVVGDGKIDGKRRIEATVDVATLTDPAAGAASATSAAPRGSAATDALYRDPAGTGPLLRTAAGSGAAVWVATSSGGGSKGDFSATPLVSAGSWSAGGSAGAFTYSYPLQTPGVPGGPSPSVAFGYNSQVVDGRTSATNNQASWLGDGWEYNPGSITRTYKACRDDLKDANNAKRKTGDLCWGSDNATLTLGGTTTELVKDDTTHDWVTANGDGSRVELIENPALGNGDDDGEYWRVTTRDGMQYHFGMHKLPGWSAGEETTDSVLTAPVAGNQQDEPCHAEAFADSFCKQAWRWNLDYVVDPNGNAMTLWWEKETNHFAQNLKFKTPVRYDRGGFLTRIDYGQRLDNIYTAAPLARVRFDVAERCYTEDSIACTEANFTSGDFARNRIWYDTPADLYCAAKPDEGCYVPVPTFWSRKRLAKVTTEAQRTEGSTALSQVDTWTLEQSLPAERTDEGTALWLQSITRAGYDPEGAVIPLNPVSFLANESPMPNRVREGASDPNPAFDRMRIVRVVNEYGGETVVDYAAPAGACATGSGFPAPEDNTGRCFPAFWHPDPDKTESVAWFNKYVVDSVQEQPGVTGVPPVTTSYEYVGGGAWALNQAEFSKKKTRTYDQWRGYGLVRTLTGAHLTDPYTGTERGMSETRYFRGMDDDPLPGGQKRSVTVKDHDDATIAPDKLAYQGRVAETLTYTKQQGTLLTRTVDYPTVTVLATRGDRGEGVPDLQANRVLTASSVTVNRSSGLSEDTRTSRTVKTATTYDAKYGLPLRVEMQGDTGKAADESCTVTSYVHNESEHLIGLAKETLTTAGTCAEADTATAADWIGGSRVAYDDKDFGAPPVTGLVTATWDIAANGGSWTTSATLGYDGYGRATSTTDAQRNTETTEYRPATGQVHSVVTTNALGHASTAWVEPGRGTSLKETDANGNTTGYAYDALGRTTAGWGPAADAGVPSVRFSYSTTPGEPVYVVTSTLGDDGEYTDTVAFYDGLGRERQTQTPAVGEGRLVTDVLYSENGTVRRTDNAYYVTGDPQPVIYEPDSEFQIPNSTLYSYDGLGRILAETPYEAGSAKPDKATRNEYGYDFSTAVEPKGAASQRSYTDALGRTVRVDTFTDAARSAFRTTTYKYDARGDQTWAKDSQGNTWSWTYDARGRQMSATDPDTGTTRTTYDSLDRPETVTDTRAVGGAESHETTVWTGYDKLSRPKEQRLGSSTGTLLTRNEYDSAPGGIGLPAKASRYTDGLAYTTSVTGYTPDYQPTGRTVSLPTATALLYGLKDTYAYTYEYTRTGLPKAVTLPAAGALGSEEVITRYNRDGLPVSTSGDQWYTADVNYSPHGEVLRTVTGEQPNRLWSTNVFDESTGALSQTLIDRESAGDTTTVTGNRVNARTYTYDPAGNVTGIGDRSNAVTEQQCFTYDSLGQLGQAWTTQDTACPTRSDGTPATVAAGPAGDGYRQTYTYDELGNRKKLVEHHMALVDGATVTDPSKDAVTTYSYGGADGKQPHTLTSMSSVYSTEAGARVTEEARRTYDDAGNTLSRTDGADQQALSWTWDGKVEKVTGFGESGSGAWVGLDNKCADLTSASTTVGTALQLYSCNGTKAQKLRIDSASPTDSSKGALKVLGHCVVPKDGGTANGTAVVIADCTGAPAQQWTAVSAGHKLKHVASGKCLDVTGANPANGTKLQLNTCDTNGAAQSWAPADETRYIYDAAGERLMALSSGERTLYLGDTTVATTAAGALSYTERYYAQPGAPTVLRHVQNTSTPTLSAQFTDQNGTAYANVGLSGGSTVQFSKTDPFGVERGEANSWRSHRSYVGGGDDAASGLVHLGAREYDPSTGRFLSADPVLDLADPVQMNGYVYCENNPVTYADPTGMASEAVGGGGGGGDFGHPGSSAVAWANGQLNTSMSDIILSVGWAVLKEFVGWNDVVSCFSRGDLWSCGSLIMDAIPWSAVFSKGKKVWRAVELTFNAISAWRKAQDRARKIIALAKRAEEMARQAKKKAQEAARKAAQLKKKAAQAATRAQKKAAVKTGNVVQKTAAKRAGPSAKKQTRASSGGVSGGSCATDNKPNSFTPGTPVLMADGTTKPIEEVKNGDQVLATDPETGETGVETVTAEIKGQGLKHLVRITLDTGGAKGDATATLTATSGHPFWVPALDAWIDATDLKSGEWLRTSAGTYIQITAIERWTTRSATVHNLTVSNLHTYYVLAGAASVLVHNCNVALGQKAEGTYSWADSEGFKHFGGYAPDAWQGPVENAIRDSSVTLHVNLRGLGNFTESAKAGLQPGAYATDMEMGWIARSVANGERSWSSINFYRPDAKGALGRADVAEPDWASFGRLRPFLSDAGKFCGC